MIYTEKQKYIYSSYAKLPITARPMDLLYFLFFAVHLPASIVIDLQYIYPPWLVPSIFRFPVEMYIGMSRDPLIGGIHEAFGNSTPLTWFKTFIWLEAIFQVPVFILGMKALYRNSKSIYPLLAVYGASSATTTLACITTVLVTPELTSESLAQGVASVSSGQRLLLLSSYVPFFLIPFVMAIDMPLRLYGLVQKAIKVEQEKLD